MNASASFGLLLLTGGQGRRLGGPKHDRLHPSGRSWGGYLVSVFESALGPGPTWVLGHALPDRPDLLTLPDGGDGPATALAAWARHPEAGPGPERWWVVACDMVRWTPEALTPWAALAAQEDPPARQWVIGRCDQRLQPLGGFLPHRLRPALGGRQEVRLLSLVEALPHRALDYPDPAWADLDDPEDLARWQSIG